jgi:uncharacterized NAD(P)/FAD-binding protein YdhS
LTLPSHNKRIAIVGDGFSGRSTLLHLLKRIKENKDPDAPHYVITLFNRDAETAGGGIAYGMSGPEHLTNIPHACCRPLPMIRMIWLTG